MSHAHNETPSDDRNAALALALCSARSRFEAWITAPPFEKEIARHSSDATKLAWPGQYRKYEVQLAWEAWCEAQCLDPFADNRRLAERSNVKCPQADGVTCVWPDCLAIGCPIAKPNIASQPTPPLT